ncbi:alpha-1:6-mannosyl-glycoprotein 2-beta-N-acetylglucosaminyltransferase-like protein, partial [Leptotrombidium deliense]
ISLILLFIVSFLSLSILITTFKQSKCDNNSYGNKKFYESLFKTEFFINEIIEKQIILNEDVFGAFNENDLIIAIQVQHRSNYLKISINLLKKLKGIEQTLLLFSYSFFDPEINKIVREIKFAKVMQIIFPNSTQLFPRSFPVMILMIVREKCQKKRQ